MSDVATRPSASPGWLVWTRLMRHRLALASLIFLLVLLVLSLAAPWIADWRGVDPTATDLFRRFEPPSAEHWLGTDDLGRDLFQRLLDGGRVSLLVGISGALLSAIIGALIGVVAGYLGGRLDAVLMRVTDGVIALPMLPLLIVLAAVDPRKIGVPVEIAQSETFSLYRIVFIVSLTGWTTVARLVRAETLSLKARDFTRAAKALGARPERIMFRHILPNAAGSLVVATTLSIGGLVLLEFDSLLPRPRHPAAGRELGQHADRRAGAAAAGAGAGAAARPADLPDRHRLQLPGRRIAGRARPAQRAALVVRRSPGSSCPCRARSAPRPSPRRNR